MGTKTEQRRTRFPAPHDDDPKMRVGIVLEEEDEAPCSEYIVMSQESEMPALEEYLRECSSRAIH